MPVGLARSGCHVLICSSRYTGGNDSSLMMEKCVKDLGKFILHARNQLGYKKVVLAGWSGGGSLSVFYQSQASILPSMRVKDPISLVDVDLPAADALLCLAAHASRARILTECLDPSIFMFRRDVELDRSLQHLNLYGPDSPSPPFSTAYLEEFRKAQVARSLRITKWAREKVSERNGGACFVLEGTMADPRWLDASVDPNDRDREKPWCYLGDPETANDMPTGLARFSSAASWLSQFSFHDSNADALEHITNVTVPVLVLENGADDGCPVEHPKSVFAKCVSSDKSYKTIKGAKHYYNGQPKKLEESCGYILKWLAERGFVSISERSGARNLPNSQLAIAALRKKYDGSNAMAINGINQLAMVCSDMEVTCRFYGHVLGLRLSKTIELPMGGQHFFFELLDGNSLAFFYFPDAPAAHRGVSSPSERQMLKEQKHPSAMGSMNHVALNVPQDKIIEYRKRIMNSGLSGYVSPVVYHADVTSGYVGNSRDPRVNWRSVYFFGPDGELLELTSQAQVFSKQTVANDVLHLPKKALWR